MKIETPQVAFVIVNFNTSELLVRCLDSILRFGGSNSEIVVVDNASSDGSADVVRARFPGIRLIANEVNAGFPTAVNQGVEASSAPFVFLMNSDVFLTESTMQPLFSLLDSEPLAGVVAPLQLNEDGVPLLSIHLHHTFAWEWGRNLLLLDVIRYRLLAPWIIKRYREAVQIDWAMGAALLVRRETFESVGGMDSYIFLFAEEYDLQWRTQKAGWSTWFQPASEVIHVKNASIGKVMNHGRVARVTRSSLYISAKHYGNGWLPLFVLAQFVGSFIRILLMAVPALLSVRSAREQLREHWLVIKTLLSRSTYRWIQAGLES